MEKNNQKQIISAILIAGVLIAGAILLKGNKPTKPENPDKVVVQGDLNEIKLKPVEANEHILGNPQAEVVIIEYSDTQCPFCKRFHETMHQVMTEKGNQIAWVYRHFPIPQLHPNAAFEANATECAWELGGNEIFWKYLDEIYATASSENNSNMDKLVQIAKKAGLNEANFQDCIKTQKFSDKVQKDAQSGVDAGIQGTPKSFILKNGKIIDTIDGAYPYEEVIKKIENALK